MKGSLPFSNFFCSISPGNLFRVGVKKEKRKKKKRRGAESEQTVLAKRTTSHSKLQPIRLSSQLQLRASATTLLFTVCKRKIYLGFITARPTSHRPKKIALICLLNEHNICIWCGCIEKSSLLFLVSWRQSGVNTKPVRFLTAAENKTANMQMKCISWSSGRLTQYSALWINSDYAKDLLFAHLSVLISLSSEVFLHRLPPYRTSLYGRRVELKDYARISEKCRQNNARPKEQFLKLFKAIQLKRIKTKYCIIILNLAFE